MARLYTLTFLFSCFYLTVLSQLNDSPSSEQMVQTPNLTEFNFSNQNGLLSTSNFSSVLIVGVADMNGDKLDDIIRLEDGRILTIEYQTEQTHFDSYFFGSVSAFQQLNLAVADVDGNGFNDIMLGGEDDVKVFLADDSGATYSESVLPQSTFLVQGSNFVDINTDGLVDIFVCDDNAESKIWENTGGGNYVPANDWIDMATVPASDNSGNYASAWTDIDNDGDLDLYISKCRVGVESFEDVRRINQLFVNDGNNNFTEMAEAYGLANGAQTWTSDFQDIDNDGDLDCFMVNHKDTISQLFVNDGTGHFSDITLSSGLDIDIDPLQGILRDFDNNGFVDILVAGTDGYQFYENNGNQTFHEIENVFGDYDMGTFAIGDLNHDGFLDVYSGSATEEDILWINEENENNYFVVNLKSLNGNPNAIGSRIEIYGEWGVQIREVRSGESYGIMNSYNQYFGLGTVQSIDSLIVRWPLGNVEVFHAPEINQFLNIVENECAYPDCFLNQLENNALCTGDTLILSAPAGTTYEWSNEAMTQDILVTEGGSYQVTVTNSFGCSSISNLVEIVENPDVAPVIEALGPTTFCQGDAVQLRSSPGLGYLWSNGQETRTILAFLSGEYTVTTLGYCEDLTSEAITVEIIPIPTDPVVENDTINSVPATGLLTATGDNLFWYDAQSGGNLLATGNTFETPEILETTSYYVQDITTIDNVSCASSRIEALVVFELPDAIKDLNKNKSFSVFPNPTRDFITFKKEEASNDDIIIRIVDQLGRIVLKETMDAQKDEMTISVEGYNGGTYIVIVESAGDLFYHKLIITD